MAQMKFMLLVAGLCLPMWLPGSPARQADGRVAAWYEAGMQWRDQNRLDSAIHCFHKAEKALTLATDPALKAKVYLNIADLLCYQENYRQAIGYFEEALALYKKSDNKEMEAYTLLDIGDCQRKRHDKVSHAPYLYYAQALAIAPNDTIVGNVYQRIGLAFYYEQRYDSARYYLRKSMCYPYYYDDGPAGRLLFIGRSFKAEGQLDSAKCYVLQALEYPIGHYQRSGCYATLQEIAQLQKDTIEAMRYALPYMQHADSIAFMESKLSNELYDIESLETEHLSRWVYWLVACMVVLVGVGCWVILWRKRQAEQACARSKALTEQLAQKEQEQEKLQRQLEQERQRRESREQLKAGLMRKLEMEDARALERRRQDCMSRLQEACAKAERYPLLSARYKEIVSSAYDQVLHWSDTEQLIASVNRDFNHFARRIEAGYMERSSASRTAVKLCVLLLFDAPMEHIQVLQGYDKKAYRQAIGRLYKRFDATDDDGLRMRLHQVLLEGTGG